MARTARLKTEGPRRRPARLLPVLLAVLAGHALVLYWLAHARVPASRLRLLETPMFTRLLQPTAPPTVAQAPPAAAAPPVRRRPLARQIAASTPAQATPTMPSPEPDPQDPGETASLPPAPNPAELAPVPDVAAEDEAAQLQTGDAPDPSTSAAAANADAADRAATVAASPAAAPSDSWPGDTRLSYELSGRFRSGDLYGSARVQWQREGTRYQTRVEVDLPPWISQVLTSQGEVGPDSLRPEVYEETRRGKSRGVQFNEESITLGSGERVARPEGVQDAASQFVELSHRFATGRDRLEVGNSVSLWLVRPGGMDLWTYDIVKQETLQTAQLGPVEAFHLKPRPLARPRGNISAEMWFAPSLQFLPVRIRVTMGEEAEVDLLVSTIEQR